jgi:hypothetical protein
VRIDNEIRLNQFDVIVCVQFPVRAVVLTLLLPVWFKRLKLPPLSKFVPVKFCWLNLSKPDSFHYVEIGFDEVGVLLSVHIVCGEFRCRNGMTFAFAAGTKASERRITGLGQVGPLPFIRTKEKCFVRLDRTSDGSAKLVDLSFISLIWLTAGSLGCFTTGELAFSESSRKYSKALPVNRLVPDLVTTLMTAPAARPYSAENPF